MWYSQLLLPRSPADGPLAAESLCHRLLGSLNELGAPGGHYDRSPTFSYGSPESLKLIQPTLFFILTMAAVTWPCLLPLSCCPCPPLLPQPLKTKYSRSVALSEYIPPAKIHRRCFLNLVQRSVYLEWKCSERRSRGAQRGWLKGKVMTTSACVFGGCETTAENSPERLRCNFLLWLTSKEYWYWLLLGCEPSRLLLAPGPLFTLSVCDGSSWLRSTEGELQEKYFLLEC